MGEWSVTLGCFCERCKHKHKDGKVYAPHGRTVECAVTRLTMYLCETCRREFEIKFPPEENFVAYSEVEFYGKFLMYDDKHYACTQYRSKREDYADFITNLRNEILKWLKQTVVRDVTDEK